MSRGRGAADASAPFGLTKTEYQFILINMKPLRSHLIPSLVATLFALAASAASDIPTTVVDARPTPLIHVAEATIESVNQVTIAAQVPGRVLELRVDAGDRIAAGDLLVRIDSTAAGQAVAGAEAGVAQAEANLANARAEHERVRSLFERNFVSQSAVDSALLALQAAEAQVRAARAGRGQVATELGFTSISSPLAGVVAQRHIEVGEMALPGLPLVTVFDPAAMRAVADVPQFRLATLGDAQPRATVELPDRGLWVEAERVVVLPAADARTHTVRVRVELPPGLAGVVPGAFARVHFVTGELTRIVVPLASILRRSEVTGVYVADDGGGFRLRQVRLGELQPDGTVEILAGLNGGETIALDPVRAGIVARGAR